MKYAIFILLMLPLMTFGQKQYSVEKVPGSDKLAIKITERLENGLENISYYPEREGLDSLEAYDYLYNETRKQMELVDRVYVHYLISEIEARRLLSTTDALASGIKWNYNPSDTINTGRRDSTYLEASRLNYGSNFTGEWSLITPDETIDLRIVQLEDGRVINQAASGNRNSRVYSSRSISFLNRPEFPDNETRFYLFKEVRGLRLYMAVSSAGDRYLLRQK